MSSPQLPQFFLLSEGLTLIKWVLIPRYALIGFISIREAMWLKVWIVLLLHITEMSKSVCTLESLWGQSVPGELFAKKILGSHLRLWSGFWEERIWKCCFSFTCLKMLGWPLPSPFIPPWADPCWRRVTEQGVKAFRGWIWERSQGHCALRHCRKRLYLTHRFKEA